MPLSENNTTKINSSFEKRIWVAAAIISFIVIFLFLFKALFSVLLLILAGVLIALYFYGVAGIFQRNFKWSSKLSIIISVLLNVILIVALVWFVGARIQQQTSQLADTLPATIQNAKEQISQSSLGRKLLEQFNSSGDSTKTLSIVKRFFSSSFGILSDLYIVLLLASFFIASPSVYKKGIVKLLPIKAKEKGADVINKLSNILKKWLKGQLIGILFIGVLTAIGLIIIGMPMVLTLALIAGFLNFIPNFGPLIALIPAVLISLLQGPGTALIIVCMYTLIQIIQSAIEQPLIQKKMINIPPALTIIGQVGMGLLAGFWGVLLATPVITILMVLIEELYLREQKE
jgi:predicted PurR-regulated permease PerM